MPDDWSPLLETVNLTTIGLPAGIELAGTKVPSVSNVPNPIILRTRSGPVGMIGYLLVEVAYEVELAVGE